jgi:hypothetical protein
MFSDFFQGLFLFPGSVMMYVLVLLLTVFYAKKAEKSHKHGRLFLLFTITSLSVFSGLRHQSVGFDTNIYYDYFSRIASGHSVTQLPQLFNNIMKMFVKNQTIIYFCLYYPSPQTRLLYYDFGILGNPTHLATWFIYTYHSFTYSRSHNIVKSFHYRYSFMLLDFYFLRRKGCLYSLDYVFYRL